jgi:threo-3-hydroxy-L-aspartate ammonia-lyase
LVISFGAPFFDRVRAQAGRRRRPCKFCRRPLRRACRHEFGQRSFRTGRIVHIPVPRSIADGALTTNLGQFTFPVIRRLVADVLTVSDAALVAAMRFFAERMKMVVEPTGCLGAAAVLEGAFPAEGKRVGVTVSGGNVDPNVFARLMLEQD